jgi:hypothetical protein
MGFGLVTSSPAGYQWAQASNASAATKDQDHYAS